MGFQKIHARSVLFLKLRFLKIRLLVKWLNYLEYFFSSILKELKNDPTCYVTTFKVDQRLSILNTFHAEVMENAYNYFDSWGGKEISKAGFKASETADSIYETRAQQVNVINLNPFT